MPSRSIRVGKRARMRSASAGWRAAYSSNSGNWPRRSRAAYSSASCPSSTESSGMVGSLRWTTDAKADQQAAQPFQGADVALGGGGLADLQQPGDLLVAQVLE